MKRLFRSLIKIIPVAVCVLSLNINGLELAVRADETCDARLSLSSHFSNQKKRRRTRRKAKPARNADARRTEFTVNTDMPVSAQPRIVKGSPDYIEPGGIAVEDKDVPMPPPKPTPKPPPRAPISGGVLNGRAILMPKPPYPSRAKAAGVAGTVLVQVTIDESGKVISARAISGHPLLQAAAVQAAYETRFAPTQLSGQPVKVTGVLQYNFVK